MAESQRASQGKSVLIVDDDPAIVQLTKLILEEDGFTAFTASNAEQAIERLSTVSPSIILLDVNMPGQDGYQLCTRIRRDYDHIKCPIVFFTANNTADHLQKARDAGADYFVIKPFTVDTLIAGVKRGFIVSNKKRRG